MSNLIQILPKIWGVKVPLDASDFMFSLHGNVHLTYVIKHRESIDLGNKNDFEILGTVTKSEISFDASDVVDESESQTGWYKDYRDKTNRLYFMDSMQSFRSALPEDIIWENTLTEPLQEHFLADISQQNNKGNIIDLQKYQNAYKDWQTAQQQITEKLLIVQEV